MTTTPPESATPIYDALRKHERHHTHAETMYWFEQYRHATKSLEEALTQKTAEVERLKKADQQNFEDICRLNEENTQLKQELSGLQQAYGAMALMLQELGVKEVPLQMPVKD